MEAGWRTRYGGGEVMGVRMRSGAALLGLLLAGCSAAQAQPGQTFSVRQTKPAVVRGIPPQRDPLAMQFLSAEIGFMAVAQPPWTTPLGSAGAGPAILLATSDGGRSWTRHALPADLEVTGLDFTSAQSGFLVGKTKNRAELFATSNGGATWQLRQTQRLRTKPYRESLDKVALAAGGREGYALLDGILYRTADGGRSWQAATLPARANDVLFLSPTVGLATSDRRIWRTADAGGTWQAVWQLPASLFVADTYFLGSGQIDVPYGSTENGPSGINLLAVSGSTAWAVFNEGSACAMPHCSSDLVLSRDGGLHWQLKTAQSLSALSQMPGPLPVVTRLSASSQGAFAVGQSGNDLTWIPPAGRAQDVLAQGVQIAAISLDGQGGIWVADPGADVLHSSAATTSFRPVWPPLSPNLGIQFVTRNLGYGMALVAGHYSLLATRDAGRTWQMLHAFASGVTLSGFTFTRTGVGYVFATTPSVGRLIPGQVLRSGDGGRTWRVVRRIGDAAGWIGRVNLQAFAGQEVLQGLPRVRISQDGGKTWHTSGSVPFSGPGDMLATWFLSPSQGWALDAPTGVLYRTASGGAGWRRVGRLPASNYAAVDFVNAEDGWVLAPGQLGAKTLLRTTDGGIVWKAEALPQTAALEMFGLPDRALSFVSAEVGYLDTNSGIYRTGDGGRTWSRLR